jgi:single-strand DNA-binding protein
MEITGRITADARITTVKGDKELVSFSIALNDRYKDRSTGDWKESVSYFNVVWWKGTGIAKILRKGAIVTVSGFPYVSAFTDKSGNVKGNMNCRADRIKLLQRKSIEKKDSVAPAELAEPLKDLPF